MRRLRWFTGAAAPTLAPGSGLYEGWIQPIPNVDSPTSFKLHIRNPENGSWDEILDTGGISGIPAGGAIGEVLTKLSGTDGDADWLPAAGYAPDQPPASPNGMDDEFTTTPTLWAWQNQGTASYAIQQEVLRVTLPANSGENWRHLSQALPVGNWEFRAKMSARMRANSIYFGLSIRETGGKFIYCGHAYSGAGYAPIVQRWNGNTSWNSNPVLHSGYWGDLLQPCYLSVRYNGSTLYWGYSLTGFTGSFWELHSETPANFLGTPAQVCLSFDVNDAGEGSDFFVEWFRRVA